MRILSVDDIRKLIAKVSLEQFFLELIKELKQDFARWQSFQKSPRHASYYPQGVIELMPISDDRYYSFKYVNGHPENARKNRLTVVATGQLSHVDSGYPILYTEMTLLTAMRTAATSALASTFLAPSGAKTFGIIGTGAQSEFQVLAHLFSLGITDVFYFDLDVKAMAKFEKNLSSFPIKLHRCSSAEQVLRRSLIVTTATAQKGHNKILQSPWIEKGIHINKIGGDSPGKTEIDPAIIQKSKIVVELLEQTIVEGEIQKCPGKKIYAELWELASGQKEGRTDASEITLFDSVGFALEDYSVLRLVERLAKEHRAGHEHVMTPEIENSKDLFGLLI